MFNATPRKLTKPRARWVAALALFSLLIAATLLAPHRSARAAADGEQNGPLHLQQQDCASTPSFAQCDHQDPVAQGCAADATTREARPILYLGRTVGRLEQRHSARCESSWGRVFSFTQGNAELGLSSSSFGEDVPDGSSLALLTGGPDEVYSDMVFGGPPTLVGMVVFSAGSQASAQLP